MKSVSISGFFKRRPLPEQFKDADRIYDKEKSKEQGKTADECTESSIMDLRKLKSLKAPVVKT